MEITTCKLTSGLFAQVRIAGGNPFNDVRVNDNLTMKVKFIDFDALASLLEKREPAHRPVYVFALPSFEGDEKTRFMQLPYKHKLTISLKEGEFTLDGQVIGYVLATLMHIK